MAYKRNHAVCSLWHLDSFTQHNGLKVHPSCLSVGSSHLFIVEKYSMVCSSLPLKVKFWVVSGLVWLLINKATVSIHVPGLPWTPAFISLGKILRKGSGWLKLTFEETAKSPFQVTAGVCISRSLDGSSSSSQSSPTLAGVNLFHVSQLGEGILVGTVFWVVRLQVILYSFYFSILSDYLLFQHQEYDTFIVKDPLPHVYILFFPK